MAEISIFASLAAGMRRKDTLNTVDNRGGWRRLISESYPGAWQQNVELRPEEVMANFAVYSCMTLIAGDIAKLRPRLTMEGQGIWEETTSPSFSPVLRRPNGFQNWIQFMTGWMISKLSTGNTYVLKARDERGVVVQMYILDPRLVVPLVSDDGEVYYRMQRDDLSHVGDNVVAPAREIIHDRMNPLFHPLVGVSPLFANGLAAAQGLRIQNNSESFFLNQSVPGGILTAPEEISDETAKIIKDRWDESFSGNKRGRVAVLGDGLKYEKMGVSAVDAQLIEQLKWTAEAICAAFHVPPYMVNIGPMPSDNNVAALKQQYYDQCLHILIESIEACLDDGLRLPSNYRTELDVAALLRMDVAARFKANSEAVRGGWFAPNEARRGENLPPVDGGESPFMQQQNWSLEQLSKRDIINDAPGVAAPPVPTDPAADPAADPSAKDLDTDDIEMLADALLRKELADAHYS